MSDYDVSRDVATRIKDAQFVVINHPHTLPTILEFLRTNPAGEPASQDHGTTAGLSSRKVEVLRLLAAGRSNQQIANELVISLNTVRRHVSNVFDKTGAANRVEVRTFARDHGIA
jgi:DNA-binding NarL/FixJ family response regulator